MYLHANAKLGLGGRFALVQAIEGRWANKGVPSEEILESLRPLLELPVGLVLPTHGAPTDRTALEHALEGRSTGCCRPETALKRAVSIIGLDSRSSGTEEDARHGLRSTIAIVARRRS